MKCDHLRIQNFDTLENTVLHLGGNIAYFLLTDRDSKEKDPTVAKVFFTTEALRKYLEQLTTTNVQHGPPPAPDAADVEELLPDDDEPEDDESEEDEQEDQGEREERQSRLEQAAYLVSRQHYSHEELLQAIVLWVKLQVTAVLNDCASRRFMLRAYAAKGSKTLCTISFTGENTAWRPPARAPEPPQSVEQPSSPQASSSSAVARAETPALPPGYSPPGSAGFPYFPPPPGMLIYPASFQDGTLYGTSSAFKALSEGYQDLSKLLIGGVSQIQGMSGDLINRMGSELQSSRAQVDQLVDDILDHRIKAVEIQGQLQESASESNQKMVLAREALGQIGEALQVFAQSRGLSPELSGVLGRISSNPELMSALSDPRVQALMEDDEHLSSLATFLRQVAQQAGGSGAGQGGQAPGQSTMPGLAPGAPSPRALPGGVGQSSGMPMGSVQFGGMPQPLTPGFYPGSPYPPFSQTPGYPPPGVPGPPMLPYHPAAMAGGYPFHAPYPQSGMPATPNAGHPGYPLPYPAHPFQSLPGQPGSSGPDGRPLAPGLAPGSPYATPPAQGQVAQTHGVPSDPSVGQGASSTPSATSAAASSGPPAGGSAGASAPRTG